MINKAYIPDESITGIYVPNFTFSQALGLISVFKSNVMQIKMVGFKSGGLTPDYDPVLFKNCDILPNGYVLFDEFDAIKFVSSYSATEDCYWNIYGRFKSPFVGSVSAAIVRMHTDKDFQTCDGLVPNNKGADRLVRLSLDPSSSNLNELRYDSRTEKWEKEYISSTLKSNEEIKIAILDENPNKSFFWRPLNQYEIYDIAAKGKFPFPIRMG